MRMTHVPDPRPPFVRVLPLRVLVPAAVLAALLVLLLTWLG